MQLGLIDQAALAVFLFTLQCLFLRVGNFSSPVCLVLSLSAHRSRLFLFRQVNTLDCALYLSSTAHASLTGLTDLIGSDCWLPLSFTSLFYLADQQAVWFLWL